MFSYSNRPPRRKFMNDEPTMTIQSAAADCDINNLIKRLQPDGSIIGSSVASVRPQFGDFSDVRSYHEAQNILLDAADQFASLPAVIRDRFQNNPALLLQFLENPDNLKEAVELGICSAPLEPEEPVVSPSGD